MGIKWFDSFLKQCPETILRRTEVSDTYLIVDGSELLYNLYFDSDKIGRGDYGAFRENIETFVSNLRECGIKPVIVVDGFKFTDNRERYLEKKEEKIMEMRNLFAAYSNRRGNVKPTLTELTLKQTLDDLNVPVGLGSGDTDQDTALLANLLEAPVLASDTVYCAFKLENGFLPFRSFEWKQVRRDRAGQAAIRAQVFQQTDFASQFQIDPSSIPYLAVAFSNVTSFTFDEFEAFRNVLKSVNVPARLRGQRQNLITNFLVWLRSNYTSDSDVIDRIVACLPHEGAANMRGRILAYVTICRRPQARPKIVEGLKAVLDLDPWVEDRFDDEANLRAEDEETFKRQGELGSLIEEAASQRFPAWALRLLLQDEDDRRVDYLPPAITDPSQFESPHQVTRLLRGRFYQLLLHRSDSMEVAEIDRNGMRYEETYCHHVVAPEVNLGPHGAAWERDVSDETVLKNRRDFLLETLTWENERDRAKLDEAFTTLSPDLRLAVAASLYWIAQSHPDPAAVKALAFQLAVCHGSSGVQQRQAIQRDLERSMPRTRAGGWCPDTQALHWSSEWQVCLREANAMNQLLDSPLTEPRIGRVCQGSLFEVACVCALAGRDLTGVLRAPNMRDLYAELYELLKE